MKDKNLRVVLSFLGILTFCRPFEDIYRSYGTLEHILLDLEEFWLGIFLHFAHDVGPRKRKPKLF